MCWERKNLTNSTALRFLFGQFQVAFLFRLLLGVNEKIAHSAYFGTATKYNLLYVSNQGRAEASAGARVRARAKG